MNIRRIIREEMDGLEWIKDTNPLKEGHYYVDADGLSREERLDLQQKILDLGFRWDERYNIPNYIGDNLNHIALNTLRGYVLNGVNNRITYSVKSYPQYARNWLTYLSYNDFIKLYNQNLNESEDLEWIKENPIEVGKCFRIYDFYGNVDAIVTIKEIEQREWKDNIRQKGGKFNPDDIIIHLVGVTQKDKERVGPNYRISYNDLVYNINNGFEVPTDCGNSINESDDLQWIKDIKPIPELKIGTCFIDVMDSTKTEWIITDFKMTPGGTDIVVIKNKKNNVDIRHMHEKYFEEDLLAGRYKPC